MNISRLFFAVILLLSFVSCRKTETQTVQSGNVAFRINHCVDGLPVRENELIYTNAAGNQYSITGIQYFISDITFYRPDGSSSMIQQPKSIFYINEDIPATRDLVFSDKIPAGAYDSITFIFGIPEAKNKSFMFVNPPEVNMAWPEVLGGGYHYMMMDGKWSDPDGIIQSFAFHLGIGQLYHGEGHNTDSIYAFVQNYFKVSLPGSAFTLHKSDTLIFNLQMNIENWFRDPHIYDHNQWGGMIMQNQDAMQMIKENGWDAFSVL
ncbi:MAG: hypothetical protein M0P58_09100 [Bacteroidales bacterium]|nr:hypothetical protein [Bacteroidales bacterium]